MVEIAVKPNAVRGGTSELHYLFIIIKMVKIVRKNIWTDLFIANIIANHRIDYKCWMVFSRISTETLHVL